MNNQLKKLQNTITARKGGDTESSYTAKLFSKGTHHIGKKVVEEAHETAVAALYESNERLASEGADLLFHLIVLLQSRGLGLEDVMLELKEREGVSGFQQKLLQQRSQTQSALSK